MGLPPLGDEILHVRILFPIGLEQVSHYIKKKSKAHTIASLKLSAPCGLRR